METIYKGIQEDHFKNHKITLHQKLGLASNGSSIIEIIDWKEPGTSRSAIRFMYDSRCNLYISGDHGEAVYCFGPGVSLYSVCRSSLAYIHRRMQASEYGRLGMEWNADIVESEFPRIMEEFVSEMHRDGESFKDSFGLEHAFTTFSDLEDRWESHYYPWRHNVSDQHEWINWCKDHESQLPGDAWEWAYSLGMEIPYHIKVHVTALKMIGELISEPVMVTS